MAKRQIGQRMKSLKTLKDSMKGGKGGAVTFIPKNGEITVRFLEEPEGNWVKYAEHYDQLRRTAFPCIGDDCPGCDEGIRKSNRFLANAVDVEKDKAIVILLPMGLAESLVKYYERNDTLMDRDYVLVREGEGLETSYYAQPEDKFRRKLTKYEVKDLDAVLEKMAADYFDDEDEDDEEEVRTVRKRQRSEAAPKKRRRPVDDDDEDDDEDEEDEDDEDDVPVRRKKASKVAPKRRRPDPDEDVDEDEEDDEDDEDEDDDDIDDEDDGDDEDEDEDDEDEDDEEEDDDEFYTEEELSGMNLGQLRTIAKEYEIKTTGLKKAELVAAILGD